MAREINLTWNTPALMNECVVVVHNGLVAMSLSVEFDSVLSGPTEHTPSPVAIIPSEYAPSNSINTKVVLEFPNKSNQWNVGWNKCLETLMHDAMSKGNVDILHFLNDNFLKFQSGGYFEVGTLNIGHDGKIKIFRAQDKNAWTRKQNVRINTVVNYKLH